MASLAKAARRQRGCWTYEQAIDAGISHDKIARNVVERKWDELELGVYRALPAGPTPWQQRLTARTLSVDGRAFGRSGLALYGVFPQPRALEVLVVRSDRNRQRDWIHSTRSLPDSDCVLVQGIPATMPARTIIDAAASMTQSVVNDLVDKAVVRELVRPETLERRARELRNSKRPGCAKVLAALAAQHADLAQARSDWEARLLRLAVESGLPELVPNYAVTVDRQRRILDVAHPPSLVDVEFDGFAPHMVRAVFDDDRVRQNASVLAGWTVIRVTSKMLEDDPAEVVATIRAAIEIRGHRTSHMCEVS